ncbi:hypothetical protein GGF43_001865 [Coemansia sp. RSA 2618]|nr:hypothetical protein GGF43_001865 [Coemansia sp. RSA 2618]
MAYKYLSGPLALYVLDRTYRAIRSTFAKSPIRAVVQHPSGIVELQLDKRVFNHRVGQYVKIYCPSVSLVQWHPLTISSAPEEELLTVHFRLSGGWTARLAKRLGCNFDANPRNSVLQQIVSPRSSMAALPTPGLGIPYHLLHHDPSTIPIYSRAGGNSSYVSFDMTTRGGGRAMHGALDKDDNMKPTTIALEDTNKPGTNTLLELSRMESGEIHTKAGNDLPAIFIDGPYTAPSEHFFDYKVGVLIAAGIGVTPAAAILRSIYFRWLHSRESLETKKVYLFWVYRDIHTLEWFKDLLVALGEEGLESVVEVHTYFTGKIPEGSNSQLSPKGDRFGERIFDTPIGTTSYVGRPDFDTIFEAIGALHPDTSIGTFFSGPRPMLHTVRRQAHKWDSRLNKQTNTSIDFYSEKF